MTTVRRHGGIIQIHDNRITWLTENVSKTKYCIKHVEKCKKKCLNFAQKAPGRPLNQIIGLAVPQGDVK